MRSSLEITATEIERRRQEWNSKITDAYLEPMLEAMLEMARMYGKRTEAWEVYSKLMDYPELKGFDYTISAVKLAFEAGWKAHKDYMYVGDKPGLSNVKITVIDNTQEEYERRRLDKGLEI